MDAIQNVKVAVMGYIAKSKMSGSGREASALNEHLQLKEDLGVTSLDMVILLTEVCGESDIDLLELSDLDILRMRTVGDIITVLSEKKRGSAVERKD
jgi:acyl carrier protein